MRAFHKPKGSSRSLKGLFQERQGREGGEAEKALGLGELKKAKKAERRAHCAPL